MKQKFSPLVNKVLLFIISISVFFSIITTAFQLYGEFKLSEQLLYKNIDHIEKSYVPTISDSLFNLNNEKLLIELNGILKLDHLVYASVYETPDTTQFFLSTGSPQSVWSVKKTFDLFFPKTYNQEKQKLGELTIRISYEKIYKELFQKLFIILFSNIVTIFAISLSIFLFIKNHVTRHLSQIAHYANDLNLNEDKPPLSLHRKKIFFRDEVDELCDSLNGLRLRIRQDIYSLKESQEEMFRMQKLESLGTMMSGITHDFNNIMRSIMSYIELGQSTCAPQSSTYENLENAIIASNRASELIKQILYFCKQDKPNIEIINISEAVMETLSLIHASCPPNIHIDSKIEKNLYINADKSQIIQVLLNLTTNSIHAMKGRSGNLFIELKKNAQNNQAEYVSLDVTDTGHGIPLEIRKKIFDPFFTTKNSEEGTGLGLSVVHGIVTKLQGSIELYSVVNHGAKFTILLPTAAAPIKQNLSPLVSDKTKHATILLIDDEGELGMLTTKTLTRLGYRVIFKSNPSDALTELGKLNSKIDLIITDFTMPTMNGIDLAIQIKKKYPHLPIILSTGIISNSFQKYLNDKIIDDVLQKPYRKNELAKLIDKNLQKFSQNI
ncbi:MAG: hypothetical protein A2202_01660 [Bdellovibrionales bacterium RIFOXYA1_FULL_36_14]|nr:MAG: hypothetical protein A2202_01660 [Bdellovibrionales bacterium RIFOXYA1_FULL_36_14]